MDTSSEPNATITLKEAATLLGFKDMRSIISWCQRNNVIIISTAGTKNRYVHKMQFEYARLKQFLNYLKATYKEDWLKAFQVYASMNIAGVVEMEEQRKLPDTTYKPAGEHEARFLLDLAKKK